MSQELFLAVTNTYANAVIYKWKDNQFEKFQEIRTEEAEGSTAFEINHETLIVFANSQQRNCPFQSIQVVREQLCQTAGSSDV